MAKIEIESIGHFSCDQQNKYDSPRQAPLSSNSGTLRLRRGIGFEQALVGLQPGDWIWILFVFHKNENWKPMVRPSRGARAKIGVFATRAPYRPNPVGMSVVQIKNIDGLNIEIVKHDLLDGSPIIDIKPYLDSADSFPGVAPSWLDEEELHSISWDELALLKAEFLENQGVAIRSFLEFQLQFNPTDATRKRVTPRGDKFEISYRTWRALFEVNLPGELTLIDIYTGYDDAELVSEKNPWEDKELHLKFAEKFQSVRTDV